MADNNIYTFVVNDENIINSYGFRVLTAGIDIKQYKRNPIVIWFHKRDRMWGDSNNAGTILPIGKAIKLYKEGGKLMADVQFDMEDEFAAKIAGKVERGYLNMCSAGLRVVAKSEEKKYLLEGQTRPTLTKSRLEEISIVDIGANDNAVRLSTGEDVEEVLPLINLNLNKNKMEFKQEVALAMGLQAEAADDVVMSQLRERVQLAKRAETAEARVQELESKMQAQADAAIVALVDANVDKKFTADKKEQLVQLGKKAGIEDLRAMIEMMPNIVKPGDVFRQSSAGAKTDDATLTFAKLAAQGVEAVEAFKKEKPAEYAKLYKAEYGVEPQEVSK